MTINQAITEAKAMGIKLTNAELGTGLCEQWLDRVALAVMHRDADRRDAWQIAINEANRVAI